MTAPYRTPRRPARRLASLRHRLATLFGRSRREADLDEELRFHLEAQIEENLARGMDPQAARAAALRTFGGVDQVKEACRDERGLPWLETSVRDVRWSLRSLRKSSAFTATAVIVLALGIGATTAVFSVVHGVLLEPLPFPEPDRLLALWEANPERGWDRANASPANLLDWRERSETLADVTGHGWEGGWTLAGVDGAGGRLDRVEGVEVMANFFSVLGAEPPLGPGFPEDAHWLTGERTVVLSHALWRNRFGGDPAIVGRRVTLNAVPHTVVGIAAEGFAYPLADLDVWVPFDWQPGFLEAPWFRFAHFVRPIARLAPGATPEEAGAELAAIAAQLEQQHPETNRGYQAGVTPLRDWLVGDVRQPLLILFVAVVLVLFGACANTANLLLARAGARSREMAMRSALGASRTRLVRQLLSESLTLAFLGGAAGLLLALAGTRILARLASDALPLAAQIGVDGPVLAAALAVTLGTGLLFGILPALRLSRRPSAEALKEGSDRAAGGVGRSRALGLLVVAEVAVAVVLVVGAGLALRSFAGLVGVEPGFEAEDRTAATYFLAPARHPESERVVALSRRLLERVRGLPGVESAALASSLPLGGVEWSSDFTVEGRPDEPGIDFARRIVSPGYFRTMGVPLLAGRSFGPGDDERGSPVVVVNETLARLHFGAENPVGRRLAFGREPADESVWREVVGVVGDEKIEGLAAPGRMEVFVPLGQELLEYPRLPQRQYRLVAHAPGYDPETLAAELRAVALELDPELLLFSMETLESVVAGAAARERLLMLLLGLFAALALVLAAVGLYGLMAYAVAGRRREIGIRLALGASGPGVVAAILARGMGLFASGLALGLAAALLLGRSMEAVLFGVRPGDPATLAAGTGILALAAFAAAYLPARRAARIDPMETLRVE
jgi:putative ABC transport system permease protein